MIRLSLYHRLILGTFFVWGTILILNTVGLWRVRDLQEQGLSAYRAHSAIAARLAALEQSLGDLQYQLTRDPASLGRKEREVLQLATDGVERSLASLVLSLQDDSPRPGNLLPPEVLTEKWPPLQQRTEARLEAVAGDDTGPDAESWLAETRTMAGKLARAARDMNLQYLGELSRDQATARRVLGWAWSLLYVMTGTTLLVGLVVAAVVARRFAKPLSDLAKIATGPVEEEKQVDQEILHPVDSLRASVNALLDDLAEVRAEFEDSRGRVEQSERLAVAGRVAASLPHEIEKPLAAIKLLLEAGTQSPDVSRHDFQRGLRDIERIEQFLEEFLEFTGAQKPRFALVDVNSVVKDALQFVAGECEQRKVATEVEFGDFPHVMGDEAMLQETLVNVLLNALEAMPNGGALSITTRLSLTGGPPPHSETEGVEIFVSDEGPGFAEDELDKIFEPFYSSKPKGTGMGLTITKRVVEQHGGRVRLLNREESGAIVSIFLPVPTAEQQEALERLEAGLTPRDLPSSP